MSPALRRAYIALDDSDFTSSVPGYGNGHMDLTRLTQPAGLTCP